MAPLAANGNNLLIGRGRWFFDRFDANGNRTGYRFLGEANKADLTPSVTKKERYTTTRAANTKISSIVTQQTHTLSIELMEFVKENVALAVLGSTSSATNTMTTVTNEVIAGGSGQAPPAIGRTYLTAKGNISGVTLVALASDGTTSTALTAGTDYQIEDAVAGAITLLSTAAAGTTIKATTYTSAASTPGLVVGGTIGNIRGGFLFIGDPTSGPKMNLEIWLAEITPSAALGMLSDDFASMTLDCEILDSSATHPNSPLYEIRYPNG